jgi:hypothetical protein
LRVSASRGSSWRSGSGHRHLVDQDLALGSGVLRDAVAGLDDRRLVRSLGGGDAGGLGEEAADRDRVGGVVGALVDHLQRVVGPSVAAVT